MYGREGPTPPLALPLGNDSPWQHGGYKEQIPAAPIIEEPPPYSHQQQSLQCATVPLKAAMSWTEQLGGKEELHHATERLTGRGKSGEEDGGSRQAGSDVGGSAWPIRLQPPLASCWGRHRTPGIMCPDHSLKRRPTLKQGGWARALSGSLWRGSGLGRSYQYPPPLLSSQWTEGKAL